ncbi:hypothetical protein NL676_031190 [Syzygium grande]|nr:hypothetical protein NL676_031190 [Syzygium grande]
MSTLKSAFDSAKSSFFDILRSLKPGLVIFDYLQPWASVAVSELNINAVVFLTMGAASCSFLTHSIHHTFNEYPFSALTLPESENHRITQLMNSSPNGYKNKERFWDCMERSSNIVLIKTSRVTEGKYVDHLPELVKKKVVTVGPLLREPANKDGDGEKIMEWLNKRQFSSVVFHGGEEVAIDEALPQRSTEDWGQRPGCERMGPTGQDFGTSKHRWVCESLWLELNTGGNSFGANRGSGGFRREEVARVIQQVMVEEKGKEAKRNAQDFGKRMREKQKEEIDDVVEKLKQLIGV